MRPLVFATLLAIGCTPGEGKVGSTTSPSGTTSASSGTGTGTGAATGTGTGTGAATGTGTGTGTGSAATAPTCTIVDPVDGYGQPFTEPEFRFEAEANDPVDGPLGGADIAWTVDGVAAGTGLVLGGVQLTTSGAHQVECTATNAGGETGDDSITVYVLSPIAQINHPGDAEVRDANQDVPFVGVGEDLEDGALSGSDLVWTSDIDGVFGQGTNFNMQLSAGTHLITLTVTDSDGNVGDDAITLILQ